MASPSSKSVCRWSEAELQERAERIGVFWATTTGRSVAVNNAQHIAKLSLPLPALLRVLARAARPGIGAAWPALRNAERDLLATEVAAKVDQ